MIPDFEDDSVHVTHFAKKNKKNKHEF
jgi:hypothetical protein